MNLKIICLAGCAAISSLASVAHATVSGPVYSAHATAENQYGTAGTNSDYTLGEDISGSVTGSSINLTTSSSIPSFELTATSSDPKFYYGGNPTYDLTYTSGGADLEYAFTVLGANGPVPVDISYYLEAQSTISGPYGSATAQAYLDVSAYQGYNFANYDYSAVSGYTPQSGYTVLAPNPSQVVSGTIETDVVGGVSSIVEVGVADQTQAGPSSASTVEAFADPRIYIDPTYLANNPGVTLEISPGVGNIGPTSAAPEPFIWVLMLAGLGASGIALRSGRRKCEPAAA